MRSVTIDDVIANVRRHLGVEVARDSGGVFRPAFIPVPAQETVPFLVSQLRSPLVQADVLDPRGLYHKVIHGVARHPLVVHILSDHPAERLNFTAWMGVQTIRSHQYEDPVVADLYLLHELHHLWTMPHEVTQFNDWVTKMTGNEKMAALVSEAFVYFAIPGLRAQAPFARIWADRFLENAELLDPRTRNEELYRGDPNRFFSLLRRKFEGIKYIPRPYLDAEQRRSATYDESNDLWAGVWREKGQEVEAHMSLVNRVARESLAEATGMHLHWLNEHATDGILFLEQAQAFLEAYQQVSKDLEVETGASARRDVGELLTGHSAALAQARLGGRVTLTELLDSSEVLIKSGITPTVYALPFPETEAAYLQFLREVSYVELYGYPFLRRQDEVHKDLIASYRDWAASVVSGLDGYSHGYAAGGSSEAIHNALAYLLKVRSPAAALHVFHGEYEGAQHYASAALQIPLHQHRRSASPDEWMAGTKPGDFWYLSQPSALDGNVWREYERFMAAAARAGVRVMVDLCYVGAVAGEFKVDVGHPHTAAVFWSLSKSLGVYYMRIGGAFFREEIPNLTGSIWFKNVLTQSFGARLLRQFGVFDLPRRYRALQQEAVGWVNARLGASFQPSDVILLARQEIAGGMDQMKDVHLRRLYRGGKDEGCLRACLTPYLETKLRAERVSPVLSLAEGAVWKS